MNSEQLAEEAKRIYKIVDQLLRDESDQWKVLFDASQTPPVSVELHKSFQRVGEQDSQPYWSVVIAKVRDGNDALRRMVYDVLSEKGFQAEVITGW